VRRHGAEAEAKKCQPQRRGTGVGRKPVPAPQRRRRRLAGKGLPEREEVTALESARRGVAGSILRKLLEGPS
jgi:hypothetical protein